MTEEKKDFTEAKKVLADLKTYAEGKIAKRSQTNVETTEVVQEMNLASQPEIVSDHLEAESALQPLGTEELKTDAPLEATPAVGEVQNTEINQETTPVPGAVLTEPTPAPEQPVQGEQMVPPVPEPAPAIETSGEAINNADISTVQSADSTPLPQGEMLVTPAPATTVEQVPAQMTVEGQQLQGEELAQPAPVAAIEPSGQMAGEIPAIDNNFVQPAPAEASVGASDTLNTGMADTVPEVSSNASLAESSAPAETAAPAPTPQPTDIPQMEGIPEIVIPDLTPAPAADNSAYQASANGAQATISDVTPAASDVNVVMPTGTTAQEANDETLVVGPESFVQSR